MDIEVVITIIACACALFGLVGSFIPGLPGPPVSWTGLLLLYIWGGRYFGHSRAFLPMMILMGVVMVIVSVLDYVIPAKFTQKTGGSKASSWGAIIGLFIGLFFTPIGMLLGTFLGAVTAEMVCNNKPFGEALKAGLGAFLGFITSTAMKVFYGILAIALTIWYI